jgi:hypothetical protein
MSAQFLRPDSNIEVTSYTGGFADIDEVVADDNDFAVAGINSSVPTLVVGLSNPPLVPGGTQCTVRWRSAKRNGNSSIGSGNDFTATCAVLQGATVLASDSYTPASFATRNFTFSRGDVTDFNDLRLRFTQTASGGTNNNQRSGLAVSWAEVEAPGRKAIVLIQ